MRLGLLTIPKYHVLPCITTVNTSVRVPRGQDLELSHLCPRTMSPRVGI